MDYNSAALISSKKKETYVFFNLLDMDYNSAALISSKYPYMFDTLTILAVTAPTCY